jgi:hypothetical protein
MGDRDTLPPGPNKGPLSLEETIALWRAFHDSGVAVCPRDSGPLALSIDAANSYRFVCTQCGTATIWFEVTPQGVQCRTMPPPAMPEEDED